MKASQSGGPGQQQANASNGLQQQSPATAPQGSPQRTTGPHSPHNANQSAYLPPVSSNSVNVVSSQSPALSPPVSTSPWELNVASKAAALNATNSYMPQYSWYHQTDTSGMTQQLLT